MDGHAQPRVGLFMTDQWFFGRTLGMLYGFSRATSCGSEGKL